MSTDISILSMFSIHMCIYRVIFLTAPPPLPPKKLEYGKPRLGESTLKKIVLDTPISSIKSSLD